MDNLENIVAQKEEFMQLQKQQIPEIRGHSVRVGMCTYLMAEYVPKLLEYYEYSDEMALYEAIRIGGQCHDIGLVNCQFYAKEEEPAFDQVEDRKIKNHPKVGAEIITQCEKILFSHEEDKRVALDMALYHHERYDGMGFPYGYKEGRIPLLSQLCGIADLYDAYAMEIASKSVRKFAEISRKIIATEGTRFSSEAIDCFKKTRKTVEDLYAGRGSSMINTGSKRRTYFGYYVIGTQELAKS